MRRFWSSILAVCGIGVTLFAVTRHFKQYHLVIPASSRPTQDAYVWQRDWTPAVRQAVTRQAGQFNRLVILAAEISPRSSPVKVTRIHPDFSQIGEGSRPIGLAIRVGPISGTAPYQSESEQTKALCKTAVDVIADARAAKMTVVELQIDFDCAESKLRGYRNWVSAVKSAVFPMPVVITALPSWLNDSAFTDLAREAGSFVMQVHSLHQPTGPDSDMSLCNPAEAERAVEAASKIGVPFRVALPTYSYLAGFSTEGQFLGLSAEGPMTNWPAGAILRPMRSDPAQIAPLVSRWIAHPPANMTGIIWYRLPVPGDSMNWAAVTLTAVMNGEIPKPNLVAETEHSKPGLVDLFVKNIGNADAAGAFNVVAQSEAVIVISEGIDGFDRLDGPGVGVTFETGSSDVRRIAPGERMQVGWLRLDSDKEVHAHVTTQTR